MAVLCLLSDTSLHESALLLLPQARRQLQELKLLVEVSR